MVSLYQATTMCKPAPTTSTDLEKAEAIDNSKTTEYDDDDDNHCVWCWWGLYIPSIMSFIWTHSIYSSYYHKKKHKHLFNFIKDPHHQHHFSRSCWPACHLQVHHHLVPSPRTNRHPDPQCSCRPSPSLCLLQRFQIRINVIKLWIWHLWWWCESLLWYWEVKYNCFFNTPQDLLKI